MRISRDGRPPHLEHVQPNIGQRCLHEDRKTTSTSLWSSRRSSSFLATRTTTTSVDDARAMKYGMRRNTHRRVHPRRADQKRQPHHRQRRRLRRRVLQRRKIPKMRVELGDHEERERHLHHQGSQAWSTTRSKTDKQPSIIVGLLELPGQHRGRGRVLDGQRDPRQGLEHRTAPRTTQGGRNPGHLAEYWQSDERQRRRITKHHGQARQQPHGVGRGGKVTYPSRSVGW